MGPPGGWRLQWEQQIQIAKVVLSRWIIKIIGLGFKFITLLTSNNYSIRDKMTKEEVILKEVQTAVPDVPRFFCFRHLMESLNMKYKSTK